MMVLVAAVLLAATSLIQNFYAHRGLTLEADQRVQRELTVSQLRIENVTRPVETAVNNTAWMVEMNLSNPDTLFALLRNLMENNPIMADAAIAFQANYYPQKGYWYEPVVARRDNGQFEEMVLGSPSHDYFNLQWYEQAARSGQSFWSEPYYDESAGRTTVVSYACPVKDPEGEIVAVISGDLTLEWLADLVQDVKLYQDTYSTLESRNGHLLVSPEEIPNLANPVQYSMPIESTGWKLNIVIPRNEIFRNVNRVAWLTSILQLFGLALLAWIAFKSVKDQSRLEKVRSKKDKMDNELRIAREIQMAMLPKALSPEQERSDVDLTSVMVPAREVGGDLYDFFIRDDKLFFCIGDVSGKGVPAALVMAVTRSLFRTVSSHEKSPRHIVSSMNESMAEMNENNMFVTFFCGVLDLKDGRLRYCNAGHNVPFVMDDGISDLPAVPNLPLGVLPDMEYVEQEATLPAGGTIVLYTDGLTEAESASHELLGEERAKAVLSTSASVVENKERLLEGVASFVGDAERSDDLTLLIIRYPGADKALVAQRSLTLGNDIRQIPKLADFILSIAEEKHLSQSLSTNINLALEEAVTNVMMYAYPKGTEGTVTIDALLKDKSLEFTVSDSGVAFDPTAAPDVDIQKDLKDRPIGGLGIYLVKKIMDEVRYQRKDGRNYLTMIKLT